MKKHISILGAGESGIGAAILAKKMDLHPFVSDINTIPAHLKSILEQHQIDYEEGQHNEKHILASEEVVKSPGIPNHLPLIQALKQQGVAVISEIELASRYTSATLIGITGSNGKTTTTLLCHHILQSAGWDVGLAGNVGHSFAKQVAENEKAHYVLEISSFQLDDIQAFRPDISILLNISPDHLDRYQYDMALYANAKLRIIENQTASDLFIYNAQDKGIQNALARHTVRPRSIGISLDHYHKEKLSVAGHTYTMDNVALKGIHNHLNASCAIQAALALGVKTEDIQLALNSFTNAPHRLEWVAEWEGILYINDSKATNVEATEQALRAQERPIIWIVGGTDKGNDYSTILPLVQEKVKAIICLGADNSRLLESFSSQCKYIEETQTAKEAVQRANIYAQAGDVVLLSPACASFDLFQNYEDRGEQFKKAVKALLPQTQNNNS